MSATSFILPDGTRIECARPSSQLLRIHQANRDRNSDDGSYYKPVRSSAVATWETSDQRLLNIEVRAWLADVAPRSVANTHSREPRVTYWLQYAVGSTASTPNTLGKYDYYGYPLGAAAVPARGLLARVFARSVELHIRYDGSYPKPGDATINPDAEWIDVQTSFTPADSLGLAYPPSAASAFIGDAPCPFPPEATEFRLTQYNGLPFPSGFAVDIVFMTSTDLPLRNASNANMTFDRALFGDWTPIAPRMRSWGVQDAPFGPGYPFYSAPTGPDDSQGVYALYR